MTNRLFAGSLTDTLAVAPADFTELERKSLARILAFARNPANAGRELMTCLDSNGTILYDESTGEREAPLTDRMKEAMAENNGVRLWHNHPSQQSLSHGDWENTGIPECLEVVAVNESGTIFVGRLNEWDEQYEKLLKKFPVIGGLVKCRLNRASKAAGFDCYQIAATERFSGHVLNVAMRQSGVGLYSAKLSEQDQAAFDFATEKNVIADALSLALTEVKGVLAEGNPS